MVRRTRTTGLKPKGGTGPMVACTSEVRLGSDRPRGVPAALQVARLPVIHDVTKVRANAGGFHGCICKMDGSCGMSRANDKVTCLGGFSFCYTIPVAEDASAQEMEGVRQEPCREGGPAAWCAAGKVVRLATSSLSPPP